MGSLWKENTLYPLSGISLLLFILFLNFNSKLSFPILLWQPKMGFVSTNSTQFIVGADSQDPQTFYINGWNSYWLMQESIWKPSRSKVSKMFKRSSEMGLTVCRTWAFSDGPGPNSLQVSPGVFNERVLQGLDYVIVEARKHGIRLILSLVNNLNAFGGKDQYVKWAYEDGFNVSSSDDSFFSHPAIKDYYKAYVKAILTRKNSLSGVRYCDEPAVFAWELINEPRCASAPVLQAWIAEMAAFVKSLDKNHLVTVGVEGFYALNTTKISEVNPGNWASLLGSDFIQNSAIDDIDFASVHAYPESWIPQADLEAKAKYLSRWVDSHVSDGDSLLRKPVLFTEVGSSGGVDRDVLLKVVYDGVYRSAKNRGAGAGALVWQLLVEGMEDYSDEFSFVPWDYPSTYKLIQDQSSRLQTLVGKARNRKATDP